MSDTFESTSTPSKMATIRTYLWTALLLIVSFLQSAVGFFVKVAPTIRSFRSRPLCMSFRQDSSMDCNKKPRTICVVGGGFGGLYTALKLSETVDPTTTLCLIEPKERFVFLPLLYELAVQSASVVEVAPKYSDLLEGSRVKYIQGSVSKIDFDNRRCDIASSSSTGTSTGNDNREVTSSVSYDQLIIAAGNQPRLDLVPGARQHALPFYRLQDADTLQQRLQELKRRKQGQGVVKVTVMGAGYSGIELSINVAQYLGKNNCQVTIVDRNDRILPSSPSYNRNTSLRSLQAQGVKIRCKTSAKAVQSNGLLLIDENKEEYFLESDLILFTAGMEQSQFVRNLNIAKDKFGRIAVKKSLQSIEHDNVFALGDCCGIEGDEVPSTAQAAMQQASVLAKNVNLAWMGQNADNSSLEEKPQLEDFSFLSLGEMVSLGDSNAAITSLGGYFTLNGPLAAIGRRLVYVARMPTASQSIKALFTASSTVTGKLLSKWFGGKQ